MILNTNQLSNSGFIKQLFPEAKIETIAGAGHWVHAEQTEKFIEVVREFLS